MPDDAPRSQPTWAQLEPLFEGEGALPSCTFASTTIEDWQAVFDAVSAHAFETVPEVWPDAADLFAQTHDDFPTLQVWPSEAVQINFFAQEPDEIEFDFDRDELTNEQAWDAVASFAVLVARTTGKTAIFRYEGKNELSFLRYDPAANAFAVGNERAPC